MKRILNLMLLLMVTVVFTLTGCSSKSEGGSSDNSGQNGDKPLKVALLLNGNLGDKSFLDSANEGIEMMKKDFNIEAKVVEMGPDQTKYEPTLMDVSEEEWDIIIMGTWQMSEALAKIAPEFPEKKYIIFDTSMDFANGDLSNVYAISYKQNEGAFLAGALASKMISEKVEKTNGNKVLGFIGGIDSPIINDFLVGYIDGAQHVDPEMKISTAYIGDFFDTAKAMELALAQYNQNAEVVFSVASQAGLGTLDAAKQANKYVLGVDSDQSMLFKDSDTEKANLIATSVLKRVDNSLYRAIKLHLEGNLSWGSEEVLGLKEDAIGLAKNEFYENNIPADIRTFIDELEDKIISEEIKVESALGMDTNKLSELRNSVRP